MNAERLAKLRNQVRIGGKGTARRKTKRRGKGNSGDEKKLQATLKRLGVNSLPGIEEANFFLEGNMVQHFTAPKVQASVAANTYVVTGQSQVVSLQKLMPGILSQLGNEAMEHLQSMMGAAGGADEAGEGEGDAAAAAGGDADAGADANDGDDDGPPELVATDDA